MNFEILNMDTVEKLEKIRKTLEYINETLKGAYTTYNLSGETVGYLLEIEKMLM